MAIVVVLAGGGLAAYLASAPSPSQAAPRHRHSPVARRVLSTQTTGVIDFGPDDDRDAFANDPDDHPLQLRPTGSAINFVTISASQLATGVPLWTANQMGDGTLIFIYVPNGECLTPSPNGTTVMLAHCTLQTSQRWRPVNPTTALGQPVAQYANASTGRCLTAPPPPAHDHDPPNPGPAALAACGPARDKTQELAFWWNV